MGQVIPAGFGQATLNLDYVLGPSNPMAIVFGYINDGDQAPDANAAFIRNHYVDNVLSTGLVSNNVVLLGVDVLQNPGGASGSASSGATGLGNNFSLPPNTAFLIKKGTARGGRTGRGRAYQPGVQTDLINEGGSVAAATITAMSAAWTAFNADLGAVSIEMYLLHAVGIAFPPDAVTSLSCDAVLATQRRRLRS